MLLISSGKIMIKIIFMLIPLIVFLTSFVKKRFNIKGLLIILVSYVFSVACVTCYAMTEDINIFQVIFISIVASASANGFYDFLKEIINFRIKKIIKEE